MDGYQNNIDESKLNFEHQLSAPKENEQIAVITTDVGVIKLKLFPNDAPKTCENFVTLAKQGYYNGSFVFCVQPSVAFMAGSPQRDGQVGTTIFEDKKPFEEENTDALWHFSGSVCAMSNVQHKSDSRFFITAYTTVPTQTLDSMSRVGYPQKLIDKYREIGGVPGLDKNYTVFAQVFEGREVVEKIMLSKTDENGIPTPDVKIQTIEIINYDGE
jgi:peptidyl-prolyl cis-trans isomerase B (cyclophilin B)